MISAGVAFVGAIVYGAADFFGGLAARRLRSIVVTAVAAASGLAFLLIALPFSGTAWTAADVAWGAVAGTFGVVAIVLLYACLAIGPMSILSPLTAVVAAIAPMLWGLLVGRETLSPLAYAGLGVALVAVVLVGFIPGEKVVRPSARGLLMAIGSGVAIGAFLIALDQTGAGSGLAPLIVSRSTNLALTGTVIAVLMLRASRSGGGAASVFAASGDATPQDPATEDRDGTAAGSAVTRARAWRLAIVAGIVDAGANCLLILALRAGDLSIVSALTALYPAGTILLAAIVLRERVAGVQWAGLALALVAGGMLALG